MSVELTVSRVLGAVATTWACIGAAYWWNQVSPLGWMTLKPRTQAERELASFYQRKEPPFPGDAEAVEKFLERGGSANTVIPPRPGRPRKLSEDAQLKLHEAQVDKEAVKLWLRMRREAVRELRAQGYQAE